MRRLAVFTVAATLALLAGIGLIGIGLVVLTMPPVAETGHVNLPFTLMLEMGCAPRGERSRIASRRRGSGCSMRS